MGVVYCHYSMTLSWLLFSVIDNKFTPMYSSMHRISNMDQNTGKEMNGNRKLNSS